MRLAATASSKSTNCRKFTLTGDAANPPRLLAPCAVTKSVAARLALDMKLPRCLALLPFVLLCSCASLPKADLTVAADGSGNFKTVQAAINAAPANSAKRTVILIRNGTYPELVVIPADRKNLTIRGEDRKKTIIAATNNARLNTGGRRSSFSVVADGFELENLTLHNTTPKGGSQAETLDLRADRGVIRHCNFISFQDTLRINGRVYFDECYIEGDVDFIWGNGTVYFNRCDIHAVHDGYLVQSRNRADRLGYVFVDCQLTGEPDIQRYALARIDPRVYPYSQVAFINCRIGPFLTPAGWVFDGPGAAASKEHIRFEEFQSTDLAGKPLDVSQRIAGSTQISAADAAKLRDVVSVLGGTDDWDPRR
jgi:pectin methylesterase-like acyl-CoA thioesterase